MKRAGIFEPRHEKTGFCLCKNKGADQLRSNCKADRRLCFSYTDTTILLLSKSKISGLLPSVTVHAGLCLTWLEILKPIFSSPEPLGSQGELIGWP